MATDVRFDGQAVLVTGGGRGLGRAYALLTARRGARVVVADNGSAMSGEDPDHGPAEAVVAEIRAEGGEAAACTADLSSPEGAEAAVAASLEAFGRIDAIAHNASPSPELLAPGDVPLRDIELVMRVNPLAGLWLARAAWPHMTAAGYGRLLYTPSAAIYGALGNTHYAAAKSAFLGMVRCLALEGDAHGIRVNAIMPSARTRMTERFHPSAYARWFFETMPPEKVAVGAAYFLSAACAVNGETFSLGGGRIARVTIAEAQGITGIGDSIEQVRDAMDRVMDDQTFFHPRDLSARSVKVAGVLGFDGGLDSSSGPAVRPLSGD